MEALYRRFAPLIHARAQRLVGDDADEIVQEVFLRIVRTPPRAPEMASWIYVTTTNLCLDRLRRHARRDRAWLEQARHVLSGEGEVSEEQLLEAKDACRRLLAGVNEKDAAVAAMVFIDEMSQEEVAQVFAVTRTAVAKRLRRFLAAARDVLGCRSEPLARQKVADDDTSRAS